MTPALVFATWNGWPLTERFLRSLEEGSRERWQLIAVDNGSTDGTPDNLEAWQSRHDLIVLRNTHNLGCAKAWNRGIREAFGAGASLVGVVNNDLVWPQDWDTGLLGFGQRHESLAFSPHALGGPLETFHERAARFMKRNRGRVRLRMRSEALFLKPEAITRAGLYDERYFVSYEDFDYFLRLRQAGIEVLTTGASVTWHEPKQSRKNLPPSHEDEGRRLFIERWGEKALRDPGFEIPRWRVRYWRLRESLGLL